MKDFALGYYFTLLWARLFALGSLFFLLMSSVVLLMGFSADSTTVYSLLLMGFVNFYIISVQHGAIPFPRNRGGWYSRGATYSFLLMFFGLMVAVFLPLFSPTMSSWSFAGWTMYRAGFLIYLLLQHALLLVYRWRSRKWEFDTLFGLFFFMAMVWGILSVLPVNYFGNLHLLFIGFQLNSFLACAYFMLPRFSRMVRERLRGGLWMGKVAFALVNLAVSFNFAAFFLRVYFPAFGKWFTDVRVMETTTYLLQIAALLLMMGLLLYIAGVGRFVVKALKVAAFAHVFSIMYFLLGAYYSMYVALGDYALKTFHQHFMISAMMLLALSMGYHWYMLNFSLPGSSHPIPFVLGYSLLLLFPLWDRVLIPASVLLLLWFFLEVYRNREILITDFRNVLREFYRAF